jgi:hypothetical protein
LNAKGSGAWPDKISKIVVDHIKFVLIDVTGSYRNVDSLVGVIGPIDVLYGKIDRILALLVDANNHVTVRPHFFGDVASRDQIAEPVPILLWTTKNPVPPSLISPVFGSGPPKKTVIHLAFSLVRTVNPSNGC